MDYSKNLTYFYDEPDGCGCAVVIIILASFGGFSLGYTGMALVVLIIGIVSAWLLGQPMTTISDSEYDAEVARYADSLKSHALNKLGIDESEVKEIHPIVLGGYDFYGADKIKKGSDDKCRSNIYKVIMLFFTSNEVHCCTIRFKTTEELILGEATDVYFYQDIVSVSTYSDNIIVRVKEKGITFNSEAFRLTTKGGTSLTVNLSDSSQGDESVNAMRALLREKKQG